MISHCLLELHSRLVSVAGACLAMTRAPGTTPWSRRGTITALTPVTSRERVCHARISAVIATHMEKRTRIFAGDSVQVKLLSPLLRTFKI